MPFSVSPSVIVREVDATSVVPAVVTSPGAIAGVFNWGPINEPILISSEDQLVSRFGKPSSDNAETFFTAADFLSYSNALYVVRAEENANTAEGTNFKAKYPGELGNSLKVSYTTPSDFEETLANIGNFVGAITFNSNTITVDSTVEITETVSAGDVIEIGNSNIGYQQMIVDSVSFANTVTANTGLFEGNVFNFLNNYTLSELDTSNLEFRRKWGYHYLFGNAPISNTLHIVVEDLDGDITGTPKTVLEIYENVSATETAKLEDGTVNYYPTILENRSNWVTIASANTIIDPSTETSGYENFTGGDNGSTESTISLGPLAFGYDNFSDPKQVDISFVLQGKGNTTLDGNGVPLTANLANYIVSNVVERRKDCVAFLSPAKEAVVDPANPTTKMERAIAYRNAVQSSSYWFMDSGYKYRYDKYNDVFRWVPLNGDMAGLAARTEAWESPAGFRRGVIRNVVSLAFNPTKAQRDRLYGSDINPVIVQPGQGILLFGDKTGIGRPSAFDRINVRRLFIAVEKSIATVAESFLFEFNDEFTQTQFRNTVDPFLRDIQGRRGIIDYRVVSDSSVNTPEVIDRNEFVANIFIKPSRTINVIRLTFVATRTGIEFDEIVGQIS